MTLNDSIEAGTLTFGNDSDGFVTLSGRFKVDTPGLSGRELQDLAERFLVTLRDDFKQYLEKDVFSDGMYVEHDRVCGGIYNIYAAHKSIDGGLNYTVFVSYGIDANNKSVPVFDINTRKNMLPLFKEVADSVKDLFPEAVKQHAQLVKQRSDAVEVHNKHLQAYGARLSEMVAL